MELEQVVNRLAQQVERRFYGKYRGFVVDNEDPEKLGRLKLTIPSVLGEDVVSGWAMPCVPYGGNANRGTLFVPEREAGVWVEFEEGDLEFPVWVGTFWSKPGGESELPRPDTAEGEEEDGVQEPPTRKIIKTARGHTLQFEDGDDGLRVLVMDGERENRIAFTDDGVTIVNKENAVTMNDDGVVIEDGSGNSMALDGGGITIQDANGNSVTMDATSGGPPPTHAVVINGSKKICLDGLIDWLMKHTHIGNMGAPCPVNPGDMVDLTLAKSLPDGSILSKNVTAG